MAQGKLVFAAAAIAAVSLSASAVTSQAAVFTEGGDAGQTLATAAVAGAATGFSGTLSNPSDADLYQFTIATAGSYTFSDVGSTVSHSYGTNQLDTAIFLFSSTGTAIATNDDASGSTVASSVKATLAAGTYYFGISESGNEPVNSNNQLLFAGYPGGDTTTTRGPASGVNPTTEFNFNSNESDPTDYGTYSVSITSAVPEPSTWAVVAISGAALAFLRRRRAA